MGQHQLPTCCQRGKPAKIAALGLKEGEAGSRQAAVLSANIKRWWLPMQLLSLLQLPSQLQALQQVGWWLCSPDRLFLFPRSEPSSMGGHRSL